MGIVIVDLTCTNMVQCIETTTHAMMMAAQEKTQPYAT
jgi:hypothetical protein